MQLSFDTHGAARRPLAWVLEMLNATRAQPALSAPGLPSTLRRGETLVVEHPHATAIVCTEGALWITHDNEPHDHIVGRGDRYVVAGPQRMLVHALSDARMEFLAV